MTAQIDEPSVASSEFVGEDTGDLLRSPLEQELAQAVGRFLKDRCTSRQVGDWVENDAGEQAELWDGLARDMGLAALLVPEALGGHGNSIREAATVLEQLGAAAAPVPFLTSAVIATSALKACGTSAAEDYLRQLGRGDSTAAVAMSYGTAAQSHPMFSGGLAANALALIDAEGRLSATVRNVAGAGLADVFLVPARSAADLLLVAVPREALGVELSGVVSLDQTRPVSDLVLNRVSFTELARGREAEAALTLALITGAGLLASESLGVAEWCFQTTLDYVKLRRQFNRPVGSFQAIKHRLADLWLELVCGRAAARHAADALTRRGVADPRAAEAALLASSWCSDLAVHAAEECVQMHGGVAMTWEHPAHLFLKRAKASQLALGTPGGNRRALADLIDLQP